MSDRELLQEFKDTGSEEAYVSLTPNFPTSKIIPIDLSSKDVNGSLICQQGAFMASHGEVSVDCDLDCNFMRCCCGVRTKTADIRWSTYKISPI